MEFLHVSVLLQESIKALKIRPDGVYGDGTVGGAGHAFAICNALSDAGRFIGTDRDEDAVQTAGKRLSIFGERAVVYKDIYENLPTIMRREGYEGADGILLDLGVSSYQLDTAERGFSYMQDGPLDMRMDRSEGMSAADVVNTYSEQELTRVIRDYGEDRFAKNIAKHIVQARAEAPILTTGRLCEVVEGAIPKKMQKTGGHPAKRTFQALRIECNRELEILENSLDEMIDFLNPGGVLAVITFHSLEDRIVKQCFKRNEDPCICPKDFPVCVCGRVSKGKALHKPIVPSEEECERNPRAKSAKLRTFTKKE